MFLGDPDAAAQWLHDAAAHAPDDPKALANKALAHILAGNLRAAFATWQDAAATNVDNDQLASYGIQAASWLPDIEDPLATVPPALQERPQVALAELAFFRNRQHTHVWAEKARNAARRFSQDDDIQRMAADAVICLIVEDEAVKRGSLIDAERKAEIAAAADLLTAHWDKLRTGDNPGFPETISEANTAMVGWHLIGEAEKVCTIALQLINVPGAPENCVLNAGNILNENDRMDDAGRAFDLIPAHPMARWGKALALLAKGKWKETAALISGRSVPESERRLADTILALAPYKAGATTPDENALRQIMKTIRNDIRCLVILARAARTMGFTDIARESYGQARQLITEDTYIAARSMLSAFAADSRDWSTVIDLLDKHVALSTPSTALQSLAEAHGNERPRRLRNLAFFDKLPAAICALPAYARSHASVLLDIGGNRQKAIALLHAVLQHDPGDTFCINNLAAAYSEVDDKAGFSSLAASIDVTVLDALPRGRIRVAHVLRDGGRPLDAIHLGYATLLSAPADHQVALAYIGLLLGDTTGLLIPPMATIAKDAFVRLSTEPGGMLAFLIDDAASVWGIDVLPATHPRVARLIGLKEGDTIDLPASSGGVTRWSVDEVTHKFLHLARRAMEEYELRFEGYDGLIRIETLGEDITPILNEVRAKAEATREQVKLYTQSRLPLEFVARMLGGDVISFATYIRTLGHQIYTCLGTLPEQQAAAETAVHYRGTPAVLDTYTAIVAAEHNVLSDLKKHFGRLLIPHGVIETLERIIRKDRQLLGRENMSIGWHDGEYYRQITTDAELLQRIAYIEKLLDQLNSHAEVHVVALPGAITPELSHVVAKVGTNPLQPIFLASSERAILISDDAPSRMLAGHIADVKSIWLQPVLSLLAAEGSIAHDHYVTAVAGLAQRGHDHVSLTAKELTAAFHKYDELATFQILVARVGGPHGDADADAHMEVTLSFLHHVWSLNQVDVQRRGRATGLILEALLNGRAAECHGWLGYIAFELYHRDFFIPYLRQWIGGHFIDLSRVARASRYWRDVAAAQALVHEAKYGASRLTLSRSMPEIS